MGLILNNNVEESKIMSAYGLTVYGKINRYIWTISDRAEEKALITIRIIDAEGNDIFSMNMGNNVILQSRIDDTMDNFLYWIAKDQPDVYDIEKQVFKSLCASNCLFNHSIRQRKQNEKRKEEEIQRIAERQAMEREEEEKRLAEVQKALSDAEYKIFRQEELHNEEIEETTIINALMKKYGINVPLRTQGWINSKLAMIVFKDGKISYKYYGKSQRDNSTVFKKYLVELENAINEALAIPFC